MSLREAAEALLAHVEGEMSSAYNNARAVCCGRPGMECCGSPAPEWDEADQLVMDTLAPVQRALRDALAEAAEAGKHDPADGTFLDQIAEAKRDFAEWPQWMKDSANISAAVAHPPAALPESETLMRALHEIAEEWAGAECGQPVTAQEAYAIELARRMYGIAAEALDAERGKG